MITEQDIMTIKDELGEEKINEFVNLITQDNLGSLKEIARTKVKNKFVKVLRTDNYKFIKDLYYNKNIKKSPLKSVDIGKQAETQ